MNHGNPRPRRGAGSAPDFHLEEALWRRGFRPVAGCDEAGRGPLAGPVVAAAVVFLEPAAIPGVHDSKLLTPAARASLEPEIKCHPAVRWAVGEASSEEIDRVNILQATRLAMERALAALPLSPAWVLVDGRPFRRFPHPHDGVVRGDAISCSIAAASILAKTARDRAMAGWHAAYPGYGFDGHKGYPTPSHLAALRRLGPCPIHRRTFAPVAQLTGEQ